MREREEPRAASFWPLMSAIFLGSFMSGLSSSTVTIAIPELQRHFGAGLPLIQWTLTGFLLAMGTSAPLTGYLGGRFSFKWLYVASLVGFTLASVLCGVAWDARSLVAFRILQGAFCGVMMPATMTLIYQLLPRGQQAMAIGLWSLSTMLAPALGPAFAGWLITLGNWRWLFFVNVPLGLAAVGLAVRMIPFYRLRIPESFDLPGLLTVITSTVSLLIAFSQGGSWGWSSGKTVSLIALGALSLVVFTLRELKTGAPLLDLRVLANGRYLVTSIISSIITLNLYSGGFLMPLFLQRVQGVTPLETGLILLPASLAMALIMPLVGRLYGTFGPCTLMTVGILMIAGGNHALSRLTPEISHTYVLWWMLVRNVGISLSTMPASNAGMEQIPLEQSGHASAIGNWLRNVFGAFSIAIFTSLLSTFGSREAAALMSQGMTEPRRIELLAFTAGINDVYGVGMVIALAALPLSLAVRKSPGVIETPVEAR
ncbi:DHA2 family efflux MFS transporter permease subunit [Cystobacter fuscus]|uniref:DHA2 family efflux MFS transporter permease subunit n=1 Tax=Cystobacter fuscus TaxID=43 RepID=UPI002B2AB942|nr:DHA2 family efflux MFS transporter permease subunit [Cystobacter fuscus]